MSLARTKTGIPAPMNRSWILSILSLFPLVYGRSRILPDSLTQLKDYIDRSGEGVPIPIPPEEEARINDNMAFIFHRGVNPYSRKFQWLPREVDISDSDNVPYVIMQGSGRKLIDWL